MRLLARLITVLLAVIAYLLVVPLILWFALREGVGEGSRVYRAGLLLDNVASVLSNGPSDSYLSSRAAADPIKWPWPVLVWLLDKGWPGHLDQFK